MHSFIGILFKEQTPSPNHTEDMETTQSNAMPDYRAPHMAFVENVRDDANHGLVILLH